jgi:predicted enzyme involved in methoxymalonyl-ACP biosynthesis
VEFARERGAEQVKARLIPTKKNGPCLSFWQSSGFAADGDQHFTWDARSIYPLPDPIALEWKR